MVKKDRYDFFLIWGHGLKYKFEIINEIEKEFSIKKIITHKPKTIKKLIKEVYSYDYAPFYHLKSKTKYLNKTKREVMFIFIKNERPEEDWLGEGKFRHIECLRIKRKKEFIRDKFNEKKSDRRSENHVIHASDNEGQTNQILKYLGFKKGIKSILPDKLAIIDYPHHLGELKKISIKEIEIDYIYGTILKENNEGKEIMKISTTPHFLTVKNDEKTYNKYLKENIGIHLTDYYTVNKIKKLSKNLDYLGKGYETSYIIVKKIDQYKYLILDGLHRASILLARGEKKIIVAVIN